MVVAATLCHIVGPRGLLLKKASRGFGKGKWNGPGGKLDPGENVLAGAKREVYEETGLRTRRLFEHGTIKYFMHGNSRLHTRARIFSTRSFTGTPRSTVEGRVRWFRFDRIPFDEMWDDDRYWIGLMLAGSRFDAEFYYSRDNKRVTRFDLEVARKI